MVNQTQNDLEQEVFVWLQKRNPTHNIIQSHFFRFPGYRAVVDIYDDTTNTAYFIKPLKSPRNYHFKALIGEIEILKLKVPNINIEVILISPVNNSRAIVSLLNQIPPWFIEYADQNDVVIVVLIPRGGSYTPIYPGKIPAEHGVEPDTNRVPGEPGDKCYPKIHIVPLDNSYDKPNCEKHPYGYDLLCENCAEHICSHLHNGLRHITLCRKEFETYTIVLHNHEKLDVSKKISFLDASWKQFKKEIEEYSKDPNVTITIDC